MKVCIRTDASIEIGSGHVMRCLTLADELRLKGVAVMFVCREHDGHLIDLIEEKGFVVARLPRGQSDYTQLPNDLTHAAWLGVSWQQDVAETSAAIAEVQPHWLIIDHYAVDRRWEKQLRSHVGKIMVIDDLANRSHDCDLLLDQNLGRTADAYRYLVGADCSLLLGAKYALLRREFAALRDYSFKRRQKANFEKLLICMGGVDKDNATGKVLDALRDCQLPKNCKITVVLGPTAPWLDFVKRQVNTLLWDIEIKVNVTDMAQLMADSDLAIGAAGSMSWERCCLGLPTIMLVIADNQEMAARQLEQSGAVILLNRAGLKQHLQSILHDLIPSPLAIRKMVASASEIADGKGVSSVLKFLMVSGSSTQ